MGAKHVDLACQPRTGHRMYAEVVDDHDHHPAALLRADDRRTHLRAADSGRATGRQPTTVQLGMHPRRGHQALIASPVVVPDPRQGRMNGDLHALVQVDIGPRQHVRKRGRIRWKRVMPTGVHPPHPCGVAAHPRLHQPAAPLLPPSDVSHRALLGFGVAREGPRRALAGQTQGMEPQTDRFGRRGDAGAAPQAGGQQRGGPSWPTAQRTDAGRTRSPAAVRRHRWGWTGGIPVWERSETTIAHPREDALHGIVAAERALGNLGDRTPAMGEHDHLSA